MCDKAAGTLINEGTLLTANLLTGTAGHTRLRLRRLRNLLAGRSSLQNLEDSQALAFQPGPCVNRKEAKFQTCLW